MLDFFKRLFRKERPEPGNVSAAHQEALSGRETAAEGLRRAEEDCRQLVDGVKDYAIFLLDRQGHVRSWNAGAERIKGYTADEIIGQHFSRFYPEEDIASDKP